MFEVEEWVVHNLVTECMKGHDLTSSPWGRDKASGALIRRSQYVLPLPTDVPKAIQRLGGATQEPLVTTSYRLHCEDSMVVCCQQSLTQRVPFEGQFRIDETIVFTEGKGGG